MFVLFQRDFTRLSHRGLPAELRSGRFEQWSGRVFLAELKQMERLTRLGRLKRIVPEAVLQCEQEIDGRPPAQLQKKAPQFAGAGRKNLIAAYAAASAWLL